MAKNLFESYKNRLAVSESMHQKSHNGARMSNSKKLMIATVLDNTSRFINEAFESSSATQRSALGDYKKFCLNISTVSLPNLILPDIMLTQPMSSITGYVTYLRFTAGVDKGGIGKGDLFNSVYRLGEVSEDRAQYTSDRVVETISDDLKLSWAPVREIYAVDGVKLTAAQKEKITIADDGTVTDENETPVVKSGAKIAYVYDNVVIPQKSDTHTSIPTLTAAMSGITLRAHARRIAVYYSQIAAFQAKTDYGTDLGESLSTQAQGELAYEIDTEGVTMLVNGAELADEATNTFDKGKLVFDSYEKAIAAGTAGTYISRSQYYEQFAEIFARAKKIIYQRTQKFAPNYMICGANILTILPYLKSWVAAPVSEVNGPYFAGTVDGVKVFVSPAMDENEYVFGVNGSDLKASAAIYAPYMAIVPTQLLGFSDGTMSQGFSTMYDMKLLSTYTEKDGKRVDAGEDEGGTYSWLLVKGKLNA